VVTKPEQDGEHPDVEVGEVPHALAHHGDLAAGEVLAPVEHHDVEGLLGPDVLPDVRVHARGQLAVVQHVELDLEDRPPRARLALGAPHGVQAGLALATAAHLLRHLSSDDAVRRPALPSAGGRGR
jgi:hypothetical protein